MKTFIIIAAYNEQKKIATVIKNLKNNNYDNLIVVDDGSKDNTAMIAREEGAMVLRHIVNRGQGAALQTGISYALMKGAEIIVTFDADDQHNAEEISQLIEPIVEKKVEVSLGSRFLKKNNVPFLRKFMLKGAIIIVWIMCGLRLTDAHNGFRAFSRNAALKIRITRDKMDHASEIIEEIKNKKISYLETPVTIKYSKESLRKGQGGMESIKILGKMILKKLGA